MKRNLLIDQPCSAINPTTGHKCSRVQPSEMHMRSGMVAAHGNWHQYWYWKAKGVMGIERWKGRFRP